MTWPSHFVQTSAIVSLASTLAKDDPLAGCYHRSATSVTKL
jgi:hypothetical protein